MRQVFGFALFVGGITSLVCGATTNFILLVAARCAWGGCWSIIRLTGMLAVTDCVEEGVAPESMVGTMTGTASGVTRLGSAVGMAAGGFLSNRIGFSNLFFLAAALSMAVSPAAARLAFEDLPLVSKTAARKVEQQSQREGGQSSSSSSQSQGSAALASRLCACAPPEMSRKQWQLFALAFAVSCAGNGLIVSTLGAVLAAHSTVDPANPEGGPVIQVGAGMLVDTATFNGCLLGTRWFLEGLGAPLIGRLIDRVGWQRVAPAVFALSSFNGAITFCLLQQTAGAAGGEGANGVLMAAVMCCVFLFFLFVSVADLCIKAIGVSWRETTLLVQGLDLGAAVGPLLGYSLLEMGLPAASVLAAQSAVHGAAAIVAAAAAQDH